MTVARTLQVVHRGRYVLLTDETLCEGDGYPWPCPAELAARVDTIRDLHPGDGYCAECGQMAPCVTRRAADGHAMEAS